MFNSFVDNLLYIFYKDIIDGLNLYNLGFDVRRILYLLLI